MVSIRMLLLSVIVGMAVSAAANPIWVYEYGWEDWEDCGQIVLWLEPLDGLGNEPILASRGIAPNPVYAGDHSLSLVHNASSYTTPRACLVRVSDFGDGQRIYFEIALWATTPAYQIRGRYLPDDIDAGGPESPGYGGWHVVSHEWLMQPGSELAIYVEMLGETGDTVWVDEMMMFDYGPGPSELEIPCLQTVSVEGSTLTAVKDLFR